MLLRHRPEMVITSVGSPAPVIEPLHDAGALVFADVASIRHAERAVAAGADGLVLLTAGAGGQTGWLNPFVFVRAVRAFFDGPLVLAGGITDGHALRAAQALGCDLAYMGTKFIATRESMADARYKEMLVASSADDILLTTAFTGLQTNMLRPSIEAAGLDPDNLPLRGAIDIGKDIDVGARESRPKRWKDIWSAGHSVSGVTDVFSVDELVARTLAEYREAAGRNRNSLIRHEIPVLVVAHELARRLVLELEEFLGIAARRHAQEAGEIVLQAARGQKQHIGAFVGLIDDDVVAAGGNVGLAGRPARSGSCCRRHWA